MSCNLIKYKIQRLFELNYVVQRKFTNVVFYVCKKLHKFITKYLLIRSEMLSYCRCRKKKKYIYIYVFFSQYIFAINKSILVRATNSFRTVVCGTYRTECVWLSLLFG